MVGQHDEGGEILVLRAEAVADPTAHARKAGQVETRRLQQRGLRVNSGLAHDVVDEREFVRDRAEVRDGIAQHFAGLAIRPELPHRFLPRTEAVLKRFDGLAEVAGLAVPLHQLGLEVEEVEMAGGPGHEELNDALRPRGELRSAECGMRNGGGDFAGNRLFRSKQASEREAAKAAAAVPEKLTPRAGMRRSDAVVGRFVLHLKRAVLTASTDAPGRRRLRGCMVHATRASPA